MGQIIDNLNNINIPKPSDTFGSNGKTAFSENNTTGVSGPDKDSLLGYKFTREKSGGYLDNTTMKNFEEVYTKDYAHEQSVRYLPASPAYFL